MPPRNAIVPVERIERSILLIRGHKVFIDADLAVLYGVSTKTLNQAVKRNSSRFPDDFMFRLSPTERDEVVTNCDHLKVLKFSRVTPMAFTEQGVAMLSSVLRSKRAVQVNIEIMRAFVRLRQIIASNAVLARKLRQLERKFDEQFRVVFDAIRQLMEPPEEPVSKKRRIGFHLDDGGEP